MFIAYEKSKKKKKFATNAEKNRKRPSEKGRRKRRYLHQIKLHFLAIQRNSRK
jgi:hypothetical protein